MLSRAIINRRAYCSKNHSHWRRFWHRIFQYFESCDCLSPIPLAPDKPMHLWYRKSRTEHVIIIGDPIPIGSPIIVTIWKVVFANKSRKLGWIFMKFGRWGWGLRRLSLARFQRNRAMGFGKSAKKWVTEALFFVNHALILPLSLDRLPPNLPRTRIQVVAGDTWFHFPEMFPLRDRIWG